MPRLALFLMLMPFFGLPAQAEDDLVVEFVTVRETPLIYDVALTGTVHAVDTVNVGFRQGGRVIEVLVNEGDTVTAGQPLARTDPLQQEQAFRVAKAGVSAANASRDQAQQAKDRAQAEAQALKTQNDGFVADAAARRAEIRTELRADPER